MANNVNYFEIGTPDPEASRAFYGALFDWRFGEPSTPASIPPGCDAGSVARHSARNLPG